MANNLIINKLRIVFLMLFVFIFGKNAQSQDSIKHRFTHLRLEARADFDVNGFYYTNIAPSATHRGPFSDTTTYGFNGRYLNFFLGGEFAKGFSYYFCQRIAPEEGTTTLFDNTDYLYLQYDFRDRWAVRLGKEALAIGGFEYDAAPIDVYFATQFWNRIACFQLAGSLIFTDKAERNQLTLQVSNSPYVYYTGDGDEWGQGLLGYSLLWRGDFGAFQPLYSVNFFERERGKFVNLIALGNRFEVDWWSWYIDFTNRAFAFDKHFFDNFSLVSRMDFSIKSVNLFLKAGYEQNRVDLPSVFDDELSIFDPLTDAGYRSFFYGIGLEFRPKRCPSVRFHANVNHSVSQPLFEALHSDGCVNGNVGVTWDIDFLRYFSKRLNQ